MEIKEHNVHSNLRNKEVLELFWADCNKPSRNRESLNFSQHIRIMRSVPFLMKFISDISVCKIQQKHKKVLHIESHKLPKSSGNGKLHLIGCYRNTGTTCRTFSFHFTKPAWKPELSQEIHTDSERRKMLIPHRI